MTDNTADRGPEDRSRISLSQDYEVRYWSQRFGIDGGRVPRLRRR